MLTLFTSDKFAKATWGGVAPTNNLQESASKRSKFLEVNQELEKEEEINMLQEIAK